MRATLIQCTKAKRDSPAPARSLYDESPFFCDMRNYAEAKDKQMKNHAWYILSAKHGLVEPDQELEPYNERGLSQTQGETIAEVLASYGVKTVEVVAGTDYTDPLIPALESYGIDVINNFRGLSIGKRQQKLQEKTSELINGSLC